ncbi:MAG: hypothetical protein FJ384_02285 [Verrucomicrobia bacterium]|nr:hypothetical protein [Verrucomicrobiota bacterium]
MAFRSSLSFVFPALLAFAAAHLSAAEPVWIAKPGPWGDLQVRAVYLEPPENILAVVAKPSSVTRWTFEQTTEKGVREVMEKAGVPAEVVARLLGPTQVVASGNNVVVLPKVEDLVALGEAARSALYAELAKSSANEYQRDPVFIHGGDIDDWLAETEITKPQQELMRKLLWRRGSALVFSDIQALLTLAKNSEEVAAVFRTITRVRSLLVELKLPLKDGRATFIDYWSAGTLNTERVPFLVAITRRRAPQLIDATQFLPTLARRRVYTFPTASMGLKGRLPDCHWTSLNFFEEEPKDLFLDSAKASEHLLSAYVAVDPPYKFGDVLCFLDGGEGLHTCVHVADDIVLTKNGESILAPWTFMSLKDVDDIYRRSADTRVQGYRLKGQ